MLYVVIAMILFYFLARSQSNNVVLLERIAIIQKYRPLLTLISYIVIFFNVYYCMEIDQSNGVGFHSAIILISLIVLPISFAILIHSECVIVIYVLFCILSGFISSITIPGNERLPGIINNVALIVGVIQLLIPFYLILINYSEDKL